ncbi:late embryogenesis abundant protein [Senna tora]|uniref:Late embryogenesis abundant protein n=1 Tax=Senna tora TaxID=362788 RepID=A0A834SK50_9FABA|nr:late embryogenesis abundant protein [Senna tora]
MEITVVNRNYGSFRYENSTGHVKYHDVVLADVPMETQTIPARSTTNMTTSAEFMVGRLISNPMFLSDLGNGTLNMTSMATLPGKVRMLNIFKMKATVSNTCHISLNVTSKAVTTKCISRIKM